MLFKIFYALVYGGWFATSILLGAYMIVHANATEYNLGIFFMVTPMSIFLRPLISAHADRNQSHKSWLVSFLFTASFGYIPFIVWPFFKSDYEAETLPLGINWPFWMLTLSHLFGSIAFSGSRAIGDACAVNHAKRVGDDFTTYRIYGAYTYGLLGYLIGFVNENNPYLPDFVAGLLLNASSLFLDGLIVYLWPDEFFHMSLEQDQSMNDKNHHKLPSNEEIWRQIKRKLACSADSEIAITKLELEVASNKDRTSRRALTLKQQVSTFMLLIKRDFRIPLYLILIFYTGFTAYAALNYVFTYTDEVCRIRGSCSGARIAALMITGFCVLEAIAYKIIDRLRARLGPILMLQVVFFSVAIHFFFYGFFMEKVSPYWFLIESLHGLEYAFCLSICINLGYTFAREVDLILPELMEQGIISKTDEEEKELARVSLMATMGSLFTLVFDGVSCTIGAVTYGQIAGRYSFQVLWICIGTLATVGFILLVIVHILDRILNMIPQIFRSAQQDQIKTKVSV